MEVGETSLLLSLCTTFDVRIVYIQVNLQTLVPIKHVVKVYFLTTKLVFDVIVNCKFIKFFYLNEHTHSSTLMFQIYSN